MMSAPDDRKTMCLRVPAVAGSIRATIILDRALGENYVPSAPNARISCESKLACCR